MKYRIKEYRKLRKLTQEDLGNLVGLSQAQITRIEAGTSDITLEQMAKFAEALNVKPYELLPEEWQPDQISPAEKELLNMIQKIKTPDNTDNNSSTQAG